MSVTVTLHCTLPSRYSSHVRLAAQPIELKMVITMFPQQARRRIPRRSSRYGKHTAFSFGRAARHCGGAVGWLLPSTEPGMVIPGGTALLRVTMMTDDFKFIPEPPWAPSSPPLGPGL